MLLQFSSDVDIYFYVFFSFTFLLFYILPVSPLVIDDKIWAYCWSCGEDVMISKQLDAHIYCWPADRATGGFNWELWVWIRPSAAAVMFTHRAEVKWRNAKLGRNGAKQLLRLSFQLTSFQVSISGTAWTRNSPRNNRSSSIRWAWGAAAPDLLLAAGMSHSLSATTQANIRLDTDSWRSRCWGAKGHNESDDLREPQKRFCTVRLSPASSLCSIFSYSCSCNYVMLPSGILLPPNTPNPACQAGTRRRDASPANTQKLPDSPCLPILCRTALLLLLQL